MSEFEQAQKDVHTLSKKPGNADLLDLYARFKQGTVGDATAKRPGLLNLNARLKYDAWAALKGMSLEAAQQAYVDKVKALLRADGK